MSFPFHSGKNGVFVTLIASWAPALITYVVLIHTLYFDSLIDPRYDNAILIPCSDRCIPHYRDKSMSTLDFFPFSSIPSLACARF